MEEEFSVWALPPPEVRDRITNLMSAIRSEVGGPEFDPHITLVRATSLTRESATRSFNSASETVSPYPLRVASVSGCRLIYEPAPHAIEASARCCDHFGCKYPKPYRPHSSLSYGDLREEDTKKIEKRAKEVDEGIIGLSFQVSSIALVKTDSKSLESWEVVKIKKLD